MADSFLSARCPELHLAHLRTLRVKRVQLMNLTISGSHPKKVVGECQVLAKIEAVRLSHDANGMTRLPTKTLDLPTCGRQAGGGQVTYRRPSRGKTARTVWHHRGARVARQRCPILRGGRRNIPLPAVGCKALNATLLSLQTIAKVTNSLGGEPYLALSIWSPPPRYSPVTLISDSTS